ncbi:MAG: cysteine desulfurase [Clostridiales bacterium]|nr:cysteine desulfurase [Clostridiales bacterium]
MNVYFDNAATTRISDTVAAKMTDIMLHHYANPASASVIGFQSEKIITEARRTLANFINAKEEEIYFTSGGSEGDNWAIRGTAKGYHRSGKHIITTSIEHPAVTQTCRSLEQDGYEITYLSVDAHGHISLNELKSAIREDTILVSIICINNETGTVQQIEKIGKTVKEQNPKTLFHTDAVQGFGKIHIDVQKSKIDLLTASAHKIHGPKGVGFLYMKNGLKVKPLITGGEQQRNMRAGTENTAGSAALALAAKEAYEHFEENTAKVSSIKSYLAEHILSEIEDTSLNGDLLDSASPYVLNISFKNIRSEVLLHTLEERGICVSAGSACNSKNKHLSPVLTAMGIEESLITGAIRFSFSKYNTLEEAEYCMKVLREVVPFLRKYNR